MKIAHFVFSLSIVAVMVGCGQTYAQTTATASPTTIKDRVVLPKQTDLKNRLQIRKEELKETLEERKAKIASRAALLKQRLNRFKDKIKAKTVERVNTQLSEINERRTEKMTTHLTRLSEILTKLESRVNEASQSGKNVSSATTAISSAKSAIDAAKEAVETQAGNDYTIQVSSEAAVKSDAMKARDSLHTDLKSVHDLVVTARQAVAKAISTALSTLGGTNGQ